METAIPKLSLVESLLLNNREEPAEVARATFSGCLKPSRHVPPGGDPGEDLGPGEVKSPR